jgi:hypothetical protein
MISLAAKQRLCPEEDQGANKYPQEANQAVYRLQIRREWKK